VKFGLYSDAGYRTCAGQPGLRGLGFEAWAPRPGLRVHRCPDLCGLGVAVVQLRLPQIRQLQHGRTSPKVRYPPTRDALNKSGRRIFLSMCEWGVESPATWASPVGNSWRTTGDIISDNWNSFVSILTNRWGSSSKPGHWNGGMKPSEYEAHFVLWAAFKSPLLIGCDLSKMSDDTLRILTNEEVIAVSQDRLGKQAKRLRQESGPRDYWVGSSRPIRTGMRGGWLSRLTWRSGGGLHVFAESGYRTADEPVRHDQDQGA
jgi:alpha-galactosidase